MNPLDEFRDVKLSGKPGRHRRKIGSQSKQEIAAQCKAYYEKNREEKRAWQRAYRQKNREKLAAKGKAYRQRNREKRLAQCKAYYEKNREKILRYMKAHREKNSEKRLNVATARHKNLKHEAIMAYSGDHPKCCCISSHCKHEPGMCPQDDEMALDIHHVNGDGKMHRKEIAGGKGGAQFYLALKKLGFPKDPPLQVLCNPCHRKHMKRNRRSAEPSIP